MPDALRAEVARHRTRFRVAHELAHTFFYYRDSGRVPWRMRGRTVEEERFCDRFAAALLLPPSVLRRGSLTASQLVGAHRWYDVSLQVVARSWVREHGRGATLVYWRSDDSEPRVQWSDRVSRRALGTWLKAFRPPANTTTAAMKELGADIVVLTQRRQALLIADAL
jgi:hypothetical protein